MILQYWHKASPAGGSIEVPSFPDIAEALRSSESKGVFGPSDESLPRLASDIKFKFSKADGMISKPTSRRDGPLIAALGNRGALDHYVVVTGWNDPENVVLVNRSAQRKLLKLDQQKLSEILGANSLLDSAGAPAQPFSAAPTSDGR
jgi:hypothetical protein